MKQVLPWKNSEVAIMKNKIVIIGASGHGKVIANIARLNGYKEILFLDDDQSKKKNGVYDVVGTTQDIAQYKEQYDFIVAIGNNEIRKKITEQLDDKNIMQPVLIHPSAVIDPTVTVTEGTVVMANAVINADTKIGKGCIINTAATVDHDGNIANFVHLSPGVHIAGTVNIGANTWVATGVSIINNLDICDNCIIGAGAVVVRDIKEQGTYVGIPARS